MTQQSYPLNSNWIYWIGALFEQQSQYGFYFYLHNAERCAQFEKKFLRNPKGKVPLDLGGGTSGGLFLGPHNSKKTFKNCLSPIQSLLYQLIPSKEKKQIWKNSRFELSGDVYILHCRCVFSCPTAHMGCSVTALMNILSAQSQLRASQFVYIR